MRLDSAKKVHLLVGLERACKNNSVILQERREYVEISIQTEPVSWDRSRPIEEFSYESVLCVRRELCLPRIHGSVHIPKTVAMATLLQSDWAYYFEERPSRLTDKIVAYDVWLEEEADYQLIVEEINKVLVPLVLAYQKKWNV